MITKAKLEEILHQFPEEFSINELIEKVSLIDKISRGSEQSDKGQTLSEEDLDKEVTKWFKVTQKRTA